MADSNETSRADAEFSKLFSEKMESDKAEQEKADAIQSAILEELKKLNGNFSQSILKDTKRKGVADYKQISESKKLKQSNKEAQPKSFKDGLKQGLGDAIGIPDFKKEMRKAFKGLAGDLGGELDDIPGIIGKELGQGLAKTKIANKMSSFMQSRVDVFNKELAKSGIGNNRTKQQQSDKSDSGSSVDIEFDREKNKGKNKNKGKSDSTAKTGKNVANGPSTKPDKLGGAAKSIPKANAGSAAKAGSAVAEGATAAAGAGLKGIMQIGKAALKAFLPVYIIAELVTQLGGILIGFIGGLAKAADRDEATRKKKLEEAQKRLNADIESIVKTPFTILEEAAQKAYDAWDNNLRLINQTQGTSKAELQSLYAEYAQRLRNEDIDSAVAASDVLENLNKVIESGLSGNVATEFAYIATKLQNAIPTQDFFQYVDSYAAVAANAIKNGQSEAQAIQYANSQLETFASSLLYTSRELTGGFATGLKDSSDLFKKATDIAVAAKTNNSAQLGGTLTSISGVVGAIAPDLASGIVEAVYSAAVGGNDSKIVALRSLANINASNTQFLQAFANDPKKVFSEIFNNLGQMQNMSPANYMEVAEGLAEVFGLEQSAFARVDFKYLADSIDKMQVNNKSLEENIAMLASGESTLTKEQMRIRQVNEYLADEGLAYVLDNEVGREIQRHMWEEQLALEMQEATYSVNLKGDAMKALSDLLALVRNIFDFLNPIAAIQKVLNVVQTIDEAIQNEDKIRQVLEEGKVGQGNARDLKNLTTRADVAAGWSMFGSTSGMLNLQKDYIEELKVSNKIASKNARYNWGQLSKSQAQSYGTASTGINQTSYLTSNGNTISREELNIVQLRNEFDRWRSTMTQFYGTSIQAKMDADIEKETTRRISNINIESQVAREAKRLQQEFGMNAQLAEERARAILTSQEEEKIKADVKATVEKQAQQGKYGQSGYEAWTATWTNSKTDFKTAVAELGYDESTLRAEFGQGETQSGSSEQLQRTADEERFWANTQKQLEDLNINLHDVFDKSDFRAYFVDEKFSGDYVNTAFRQEFLVSRFDVFHRDFNSFVSEWKKYYIEHAYYNDNLGSSLYYQLLSVNNQNNMSAQDKLNKLTEAMTNINVDDLVDPTVQQNVLLAQMVTLLQTIVQQNNTQGKLALPDAIAAMATGMMPQQ